MAFKVDVPIDRKAEDTSQVAGVKRQSETNTKSTESNTVAVKSLAGSVAVGNVIGGLLTDALSGLMELISPLIRILSALFIVAFMPLLPLLQKLINVLSEVVAKAAEFGGGPSGVIKGIESVTRERLEGASLTAKIATVLITAVVAAGAIILIAVAAGLSAIPIAIIAGIAAIVAILILAWDPLVDLLRIIVDVLFDFVDVFGSLLKWVIGLWIQLGEMIAQFGIQIWEFFVAGLENVINYGIWIWELFIEGLKSIANFGDWIWDLFKAGLAGIANLGSMIWDVIKGALSSIGRIFGFAGGGSVSGGVPIIVGERGPELFVPSGSGSIISNNRLRGGGGITINVNNPVVREDADIRKLTEMIGRKLQSNASRGFSSV